MHCILMRNLNRLESENSSENVSERLRAIVTNILRKCDIQTGPRVPYCGHVRKGPHECLSRILPLSSSPLLLVILSRCMDLALDSNQDSNFPQCSPTTFSSTHSTLAFLFQRLHSFYPDLRRLISSRAKGRTIYPVTRYRITDDDLLIKVISG